MASGRTRAAPPPPVNWTACPRSTVLQCGSVRVPINYRRPAGISLSIAVTRAPALDPTSRVGTLVFNPGGPAESGNQLLPVLLPFFPSELRRRFDIVSFDPRGTGASDPIDCGTSPSAVAALVPVPAHAGAALPGWRLFTAMAHTRLRRYPHLESFINTANTARDLDRIRQALRVPTISYYGLSYGTVLGAVYDTLFPHRLRASVLDGAVDIDAPLTVQAEEQAPAAEVSTVHLLTTCAGVLPCPLGAEPIINFERLAASLSRHPLAAPGNGDDHLVTVGDLDLATLFAVTVPADDPAYLHALVRAEEGSGALLRQQSLEMLVDIDGMSLVDPLWTITCNDTSERLGPVAAGRLARSLANRYPLTGGYGATYALGGCVSWPAARQPVTRIHPVGGPPTLVIGNTGDPNTPLIGARHLARIFPRATQLTWRGWGHTWLLSGPGDACMQRWVTGYLLSGALPPRGSVCG